MKKHLFFFNIMCAYVLISCTNTSKKQLAVQKEYQVYCGSCHLAPNPANIPKNIWEKSVFPEMAARMGHTYNDYNPTSGNSAEENMYIKKSGVYPETATIDKETLQRLHDYIMTLAPNDIPEETDRNERNAPLTLFKQTQLPDMEEIGSMITNIQFNTKTNQFGVGDATGSLKNWPIKSNLPLQFNSPVISNRQKEDVLFITEIGEMLPSEKPLGVIHKITEGVKDTLVKQLHRPVFTEIIDLNEDAKDELLVCEFGHHTGELSILEKVAEGYKKRTLLELPGTIKFEIADMNGDDKKDIIVLSSQGREGIYILYQKDNLQFTVEQVIKMGPEYGSSWFELIDYNGDSHLDVILANGDNADYSIFKKPYHGIRLFINNGKNAFEEKWFYPIYGATRVLTDDFDLDGDLDFAVMSFFPEEGKSPNENFVYLENEESNLYKFKSYAFEGVTIGRWLVMDKGDFDQDGDVDIMLGAFIIPSQTADMFRSAAEGYAKQKAGLLLLENTVR